MSALADTLMQQGYRISSDRREIDLDLVHAYLSNESYWAQGVPKETVARSIQHSMCFSIFHGDVQVGFARVITDQATFAYLADVFVLPAHRGIGLSKWLIDHICEQPNLQGLRRWLLGTRDAHSLYARVGFTSLKAPERFMERHFPDIYKKGG